MLSHWHCTDFACLLITAAVSPAPSSFVTQSTLSMTTPSSTSTVLPIHSSIPTSTHQRFLIASPTPSTSSTEQTPSTQPPPGNSDMLTSTTPLHHLQPSPNCLPKRPPILLCRSHLRSNRACVDPGFIFVVVGLCWLIVWVGEGACVRCWCRHVIYSLYHPCG
jgi:hypothetical protein